MNRWKFFDITHKEHTICNPTSMEKFNQLLSLLRLPSNARVLEIATGKGEFITQMIERYGVSGVAVDLSPNHSRDARERFNARVPNADLTFFEMDGADYQPDEPESFDLTVCLGASWIYQGHKGTLTALKTWTKPGGFVVVGEPYWLQEPHPDYLEMVDFEKDTFATHHENVLIGESLDLSLIYSIVSNHDDWDRYVGLNWYAANEYVRQYPEDKDVPELKRMIDRYKHEYLQYGRNTLGWAIYVFRKEYLAKGCVQ